MKQELKPYLDIAEGISKLLYPFAEVVLHDLEKNTIVMIWNAFSKRKIGDCSYLHDMKFDNKMKPSNIIGPYEKVNYDGKRLKSISIVIRNKKDLVIGFLCINLDVSILNKYQRILNLFLSNNDDRSLKNTSGLFKNDLHEQVSFFVQQYCLKKKLNMDSLSREQKKVLILGLKKEGAFNAKNATSYIARVLCISRASVYNYLKEEMK